MITKLESDTVSRGMQMAKDLLDLYGDLKQLNVIYDSGGGVKETITQQDLDGVSSFSGLTKQQLDDGMFALTSTVLTALTNSMTQLSELSARA